MTRRKSLMRSIYERYVIVVVALLVVVGGLQWQSLHNALLLGGEGALAFVYRDVSGEPILQKVHTEQQYLQAAPAIIGGVSQHGVNVRLYDSHLHQIGQQYAHFAPVTLLPITPAIAIQAKQYRILPIQTELRAYVMHQNGQVLLFAAIGPPGKELGYVELGYRESLLYPILAQQGVAFFVFSVLVALFAAALLFPLVGAPLKPLRRLTEAAMRIREGEITERLPAVGTVETVRLAEVLNDVLDKLASAVNREHMAAQRMKEFISAASHELRTPLTAIRGFTDVLQMRVRNQKSSPTQYEEMGQALTTMQREIARLETLVKDLLQLARLDEGVTPRMEEHDLAVLVADLKPQLEMIATGRQLQLALVKAPLRCDRALFEQVLYNLVSNAVNHTKSGEGIVWIRVEPLPSRHARLIVEDNGEGIAAEQLERIFDRFFRASDARVRNPGGAGLGLSIVAEIVHAHGGTVRAASELGVGTTMIVDL
ncbi:MAG: HAMP domain-containing sensor histidine kinase [Firmicutes bacterium]|nr:HAMP domain-containing sensor histidine kinase [Bacillota bacterium]